MADVQAAARVGEANGIEVAVQSLAEEAANAISRDRALRGAAPGFLQISQTSRTSRRHWQEQEQAQPLAFAQTQQTLSLFGRRTVTRTKTPGDGVATTTVGIQTLITSLSQEKSEVRDHRIWCTQETEKNELSQREISDRKDRLAASMQAHNDAISGLGEELTQIEAETTALQGVATESSAQGAAEADLVKSQLKDQKLAVKILNQAIAILTNFQITHATPEIDDAAPPSLLQTATRVKLQKKL